jgi:Squalene-hopene cyclase C-terminal domain/Prenyltransferase and squalene oxidase repeat
MRIAAMCLASFLLVSGDAAAQNVPEASLRLAAQKALVLLEQTSPSFVKQGGCNSCHNQMLPAAAQALARARGVPTGPTIVQLPPEVSEATTERYAEYSAGGGATIPGLSFELFANALAKRPADARTLAEIYYVKGMQLPDGHWGGGGNRPPLTFDPFTPTAFMIHALNTYAPATDAADTKARIDRARSWLLKATPELAQERAFQVLGLAWSKADRGAIDTAVRGLQSLQRPDGGWSQLPGLATDAYATGIALYAMSEGGVRTTTPAYQAGLNYLLSTQASDGTWHVKTRALPLQPYFETGYPYEHDQWISSAGAAYATMAMVAAIEAPRTASR